MPEKRVHDLHKIDFIPFSTEYKEEVTSIYNNYVLAGTAAFPQEPVSCDFFDFLLEMPKLYPVFVLLDTEHHCVIGFCFLSPYHPAATFRKTALIDYFITPEYTGKGLGSLCLKRLEAEAKKSGIFHMIADISSENYGSIAFHEKHGFKKCGILENIGSKLGRDFSVVHMQKNIQSAGFTHIQI